jgi:hypothetical protein
MDLMVYRVLKVTQVLRVMKVRWAKQESKGLPD